MALQEELKRQGDVLFKYRSYFPLLLLLFGVCMKIYQVRYIGEAGENSVANIMESAAIYIGLLGLFIRAFTVGYTPVNTSGRNTGDGQIADTLNTTNIYSLIRNPLYLGNYLMWLAIAMLTGNIWFVLLFTLIFWIYYERIIYAEESFLRESFGDVYLNWASKTPVFIPRHFKYTTSDLSFSWKKVLKKEKNGLFALFLLFLLFEVIGEYVLKGTYLTEMTFYTVATIATGILYVILKFLKKFTNVLNEVGR